MVGAALTVIESAFGPLAPSESVTVTVKLAVPAAEGVPVIAPPEESESPVGNEPPVSE